ncbi:MAG: ABC transporter ATP-binding protein [Armatimonadota bacterium]|nr:ABC transporter ATP-binding protein [Armatimonadota bacterium]MDR7449818.1 ABC transporter ATP-binding protein [Armatimonadota bacterium]MDR7460758.1 ABC transporter ATP-binding protein [Armatimonadota bacterium]MDR7480650.1 ABC transporter ATP-binding protein [Armatimonadota bacterium]MDR7488360.1 ABC transporter ATP-binding protein [Armatimonadota bacterium]
MTGPAPAEPFQGPGAAALLDLHEVTVYYGRVRALQGLTLRVLPGEVVALLGGNGAGKSTTLRAISGLVRPAAGRVAFRGRDLTRLDPTAIVRLGIAHCPEGRKLFPEMSVLENLALGAYVRAGDLREDLDRVFALFPVLRDRQHQLAGSLSGGEQQMVAIARALMARPTLILLDEPTMGLAPAMVVEVVRAVRALNEAGATVLLVEQNVQVALRLAHRAYVLENGRVVAEGLAEALARDDRVRRAYLGA